MGTPVKFAGYNVNLQTPLNSENIAVIPVFNNSICTVSCWELSDEELAEIIKSKRVYLTVLFGKTSPPVYVGSEETVRSVVADYGVWPRDQRKVPQDG
jgi:hypothetical protein